MTIGRVGHLQGALLGELVTLARGLEHMTIPATEITALIALLEQLNSDQGGTRPAAPVVVKEAAVAAPAQRAEPAKAVAPSAPIAPPAPPVRPAPAAAPIAPHRAAAPVAAPAAAAVAAHVAPSRPAAPVAPRPIPASELIGAGRRGRIWEGVRDFMLAHTGPQTFDTILAMVVREALTDKEPGHALKIAIGKKLSTGEIIKGANGAFTLHADIIAAGPQPSHSVPVPRPAAPVAPVAQAPAAVAKPTPAPAAVDATLPQPPRRGRPPKTRTEAELDDNRHRPGELWRNMRAWLVEHPDGATRDTLVSLASQHRWTGAGNVEHAVKICLTRVTEQTDVEDGMYRLKRDKPADAAPKAAKVLHRKRTEAEAAAEAAAAAAPAVAPMAEAAKATDDGTKFDAGNRDMSQFYHKPRSVSGR